MKLQPKLTLLLLVTLCGNILTAQKPTLNFTNYSTGQGLSSANVYDIMQDSYGFLWLATEDGLNRFDGTNFKVYRNDPNRANSLANNQITSLYESKDGCIWVGTNGGSLGYYDRTRDSVFRYVPKNGEPMTTAITCITGDRDGHVCIAGYGMVYIIDPRTRELVKNSYYQPLIKQLEGKICYSFLQDTKTRTWVGTDNGLYLYDITKQEVKIFQHNGNNPTSLVNNLVYKIVEDKTGNIWFATENGLSMYVDATADFKNYYKESAVNKISNNRVADIKVDNSNRLWIGTENGLDILDVASNKLSNYVKDVRDHRSLSSSSVKSIYIDPKGIYWVGTFQGGINKYDENANNFNLKEFDAFDPFGLRSPIVTSFAAYKSDMFVGTDGGGLQLYNRSTGLLEHINLPVTCKFERNGLSVLCLLMDANERLWIGTFRDGLFCYDPRKKTYLQYLNGDKITDLNNTDIFCLMQDKKGNIWVGTNGGGINVIEKNTGAITKLVHDPQSPDDPARPGNNYIRALKEDNDGNIWVGTFGLGISVFNPATGQFQLYTKGSSGLPSDYVSSITQDSKGNIWAGTFGSGIGLLKKGTNRFEAITDVNGLANNVINKIIEDSLGKVWISTNNGLSCFDPSNGKIKNYSEHNGLQSGAFVHGAGILLRDGELFFGGQNGFNHLNPYALKTNKNIPRVAFTELKIDNKNVSPSSNGAVDRSVLLATQINLNYKQSFSISFAALDFTVPEACRYQYQLVGFDKDWVEAGKEHSAYYANIPPGEYTFKVRASNNDGLWNTAGRSIKIIVSPPFYRTKLSYLIYILLFAGILYYLRLQSIKQLKSKFLIELERQQSKELIERERKEAEYLRHLDQSKIKFLTNLSHEFRTPISLIMGPVDNLLKIVKEDIAINQLNLIKRNSRRLLNLVNQLLDFRKMEEGELQVQLSEGDLVSFIKDISDSFSDMAQKKGITYGFYSSITKLDVFFDHNKMERILFNLLSNAFKFTPDNGNITLSLMQPIATRQGFVTIPIEIKDSGVGISKAAQPYIFDSFFQQPDTTEIINHGTGIGLAIVKEFVSLHGGTITFDSEEGRGTSFNLQLTLKEIMPFDQNEAYENAMADAKQDEIKSNNTVQDEAPSVLVIEDDDDFRFYIKENVKQSYRVFEAPNGKEGWQRTLFHHPDIIVCDIQMPVMDGLQFVQKLKADKRTLHIPVILLTAGNTPTGALDGLETGAIDYITKPFDFAVLQAKINNILMLNKSFKQTYSKQVTVTLPKTDIVPAKDKFMEAAIAYIYQNLKNTDLSVEQLSKQLHISRASLYNKVLEYTGMTPIEFIRSVKLEKAKELLENSDLTINEVAYELGFASPNYFTKVFKKVYNKNPSDFQSAHRKK